jgi:hypothetical protein
MYEYDVKRTAANPNYWLNSEDNADVTKCVPGLLWTAANPTDLPNVLQDRFWRWFQGTMEVYNRGETDMA